MKRTFYLAVLFLVTAWGGPNDIRDEGVGIYTDASVANQLATFTINRQMVSCGVGIGPVDPVTKSVPLAMLMFSKDIRAYHADHLTKIIRASGRMRSITKVGAIVVEDVEHDFLAIAVDNQGNTSPDRFDIHFATPFWKTGNPLCTPSTEVTGGCRFGGEVFLGDITVRS
jgi:hypothetical protein